MILGQNPDILLSCASVAVLPLLASLRYQVDSETNLLKKAAFRFGNLICSKPSEAATEIRSPYVGLSRNPFIAIATVLY